jgi:hypothetical protein
MFAVLLFRCPFPPCPWVYQALILVVVVVVVVLLIRFLSNKNRQ